MMRPVAIAYGRALRSQFSGRMLLLSIVPLLLSPSSEYGAELSVWKFDWKLPEVGS